MLVAAMNPCPCGYFNHPDKECSCGPGMIKRYLSRISGPLLDRIDIHLEVTPVPFKELTEVSVSESSETMRLNVVRARKIQEKRFEKIDQINVNAQMGPGLMQRNCSLDKAGRSIIGLAMEKLGLSARSYDRILKVARTIADLDDSTKILPMHVAEAISYRNLDREGWSR
jgi:magnesium chelatase family protein